VKSLKALYALQAGFSGSMIALRVPPEEWYKLRGVAKDPSEDPHVTVIYMPDLQPEEVPLVGKAIRTALEGQTPFNVKVTKIGTFGNPPNSEGKIPHVAFLDKPSLTKLRNKIIPELHKIRKDIVDTKFKVYQPHTTVQWVPEATDIPVLKEPVSWEVNEVRLYFKNARRERFPFLKLDRIPDLAEEVMKKATTLTLDGNIEKALQLLGEKVRHG